MPLGSRFEEALLLAARLHAGQVRKVSGTPYVGHLLGVCAIVIEHGGDEDEAIAALLHDAVEDQGGQSAREEIGRRFGQRVLEIVDACSDTTVSPKPPWRKRKEAHLRGMAGASPSVRLVMAADKLDNARALLREYRRRGESLWSHFHGGREGTLWYYRAMLEALRESNCYDLIRELDRAVIEIERLAGAG
jgi:(p)ppGpp synthase/HD superfamily hydrolase